MIVRNYLDGLRSRKWKLLRSKKKREGGGKGKRRRKTIRPGGEG